MVLPDLLVPLGIVAGLIVAGIAARRRSGRLVEHWATSNGRTILRRECFLIGNGPFEWRTAFQVLWVLRLRGPDGAVRDAWARCGHARFGMLSRQIDIRWVDEGKTAFPEP